MIKVIVFDFDGTIIDSNQLKYDAFFDIFPRDDIWQGIVRDLLGEHRERTRGFIVDKILRTYEDKTFVSLPDFEEKANVYVKKYGEAVEQGAMQCDYIDGARKAIEVLSVDYPLYINSTTQFDSLIRIVKERSLKSFFKGIYGAPESKSSNLTSIFSLEGVLAQEVLVVGDGYSDLESAKEHGCEFVGVFNKFNKFFSADLVLIKDLDGLSDVLIRFV